MARTMTGVSSFAGMPPIRAWGLCSFVFSLCHWVWHPLVTPVRPKTALNPAIDGHFLQPFLSNIKSSIFQSCSVCLLGKKLCSGVCCLQASVCNWYSLVGSRTYIATSTILPLSSSINHRRRVKIFLVKFEQLLALICKISLQIPKRDKKCHWANLCAIGKYIDDVKLLTKLVPVASYKSTFKWEYSLKDGGEKYLLFDHPDHLEWALKQMFEQMWGWHRILFPLYNSLKQSAQKESMAW